MSGEQEDLGDRLRKIPAKQIRRARNVNHPDSVTIKSTVSGGAVANESSKTPGPFDMRTIKELVALMGRHELTEIDLREGELRIRLRRGPKETITVSPAQVPVAPPTAQPPPST